MNAILLLFTIYVKEQTWWTGIVSAASAMASALYHLGQSLCWISC